jgi:menaquinone-9 beta-reductase
MRSNEDRRWPEAAYDAVVVGARCAGAATAMLLARGGAKVLVVDKSPPGADTLSTHALMRGGVLQLHRWGLLDRVAMAGTPAVRRATFHYGDEEVTLPITARDGVEALYAPRRTVLDGLLSTAAADAGAHVLHGVCVRALKRSSGGRVCGVTLEDGAGRRMDVRSGVVVGADGMRSSVARLTGASTYQAGRHATGFLYGHFAGMRFDGYHWYYRPSVSAGAIPTNDGLTCVFAAMPPPRFRQGVRVSPAATFRQALQEAHPEMAALVGEAPLATALRGFAGQAGYLREPYGDGWALVGDAGYFRDPITSHGMTDALRDAELLAHALLQASWDALRQYAAARDCAARGFLAVTDRIASFEWDLASVADLHRQASREMAKGIAAVNVLSKSRNVAA